MASSETERCFSTLKRIKTCLRSTIGEERLNSSPMLYIDPEIILTKMHLIINVFSEIKNRRLNFGYKIVNFIQNAYQYTLNN